MNKPRKLPGLLAFLMLVSCGQIPEPSIKPPPDPPPPDAGDPCARACMRLEQLECPEAAPEPGQDGIPGTADDVPCVKWMCNADYLDYEKLANAKSCADFSEE